MTTPRRHRRLAGVLALLLFTATIPATVYAQRTPRHGLNRGNTEDDQRNADTLDAKVPAYAGPSHSTVFCGQLANNGTIFLGPAEVQDGSGAGEGLSAAIDAGGTACNALDNATEATADAPIFTSLGLMVTGMYCRAVADGGTTGSGSNGVVFTLRSAAADTAPVLSCTVPTTGIDCQVCPTTARTPVIAGGATMAVKAVSTEDLSAMDGWCRVFYSLY